jgi:indolepyruvate ferredoxin oxidoreductase beta subunit
LRLLASLKRLRRWGSRHAHEQALIDEWLDAIVDGLRADWQLGREVAACGRLIKGYGSTNERGKDTLLHLLRQVARAESSPAGERAQRVRQGLDAALTDASGRTLDRVLADAGAAPRPVREQPIRWMPTAVKRGVK